MHTSFPGRLAAAGRLCRGGRGEHAVAGWSSDRQDDHSKAFSRRVQKFRDATSSEKLSDKEDAVNLLKTPTVSMPYSKILPALFFFSISGQPFFVLVAKYIQPIHKDFSFFSSFLHVQHCDLLKRAMRLHSHSVRIFLKDIWQ